MANVQPELHFKSSSRVPSFDFVSAQEPTIASGPDAPTHMLLKQTSLEPGEFERSEQDTVEVLGLWGSTVLFARHLEPNRDFTIGEGSPTEPVDFELSTQALGAVSAKLVHVQNGMPHVVVPAGAWVSVKQAAEPYAMPSKATSVALLAGTVVEIELGKLKFRIANVPAGKSTPRAGLRSADRSVLTAFGLSFGTVAALVASFAFWMPSMGLNDDEDIDKDRLVTMMQYLNTQAIREEDEKKADADQSGNKDNQPGTPADAAQGRSGAMGKPSAAVAAHRAAVKGDHPEIQLTHAQQVEAAKTFGIVELLGSLSTSAGGGSPFVRDPALGHDAEDFEGGMWGDPGDAFGSNGLNLSGLERGGGGHGDQVALGGNGTCLGGNCGPRGTGTHDGFARGVGRTGPGHVSTVPHMGQGVTTVSGHLPAEVVQRIVRQNYGRFRMCYENGLRSNPNLTGRVGVRFVIGREGSVTNAQNGGSDLPDSGVVSCVVSAFYGVSFPSPENGIVTVTYPIMFSPG